MNRTSNAQHVQSWTFDVKMFNITIFDIITINYKSIFSDTKILLKFWFTHGETFDIV